MGLPVLEARRDSLTCTSITSEPGEHAMSRHNDLRSATITRFAVWFVLLGGLSGPAAADQDTSAQRGRHENAKQPLRDEDRSSESLADEVKELRQEVEAMRRDLREMRSALKTIEKRTGKEQGPSDFSPVSIRVQSEDGRPLPGFLVEMESARKEVRRVSASGRSDRDGLALSRDLPYGDYQIKVREDSGWSTSFRNVTVEIGKALEKVIVAPDPQERAVLEIQSAIDPQGVESLRFGERRERSSGPGYFVSHSPEPGKEGARFASFPTVGDGISEIAVQVRIGLERTLEQPDGTVQTWRWRAWKELLPTVLATAEGVVAIAGTEGGTSRPKKASRYFAPVNDLFGNYSVAYLKRDLRRAEGDFSLEIAPGDVTMTVTRVLGKAAAEVLPSLGLEADHDSEIWLEARMQGSSEWVPRILDLEEWERGTGSSPLAKKTVRVGPGDEVQVGVRSPRNSPHGTESTGN